MSLEQFQLSEAYPKLWDTMERDFDRLDSDSLAQFVINVERWAGVHNSEAVLAVATAIYKSLHVVDDDEAFEHEVRRFSLAATLGARAEARREEREGELQSQEAIQAASEEAVADAVEGVEIEPEDEEEAEPAEEE